MNHNKTGLIICIFTTLFLTSCNVLKKAQENADKYEKSMTDLRTQVYQSVLDAKKSNSVDSNEIKSLKKQYTTVQESFNKAFDKVLSSIDSNKLDQSKCVILNYKLVLKPYEDDFKNSSKLATDFNLSVLKARDAAAIGIADLVPIVVEIFKAVSKHRINVCKDKISGLKYKKWDDF